MRNKMWAWVIGTGILLMAIHNRLLTITDSEGVTWLFLPTIGLYVAMLAVFACLAENHKQVTFGSRWLWIPLAVVALSIVAADFYQVAIGEKSIIKALSTALFATFLFGLYLTARILKEELFKPFMVAVVIVAISAVVYALILGRKTGGLASPTNYDMGAGLLIFGALVGGLKQRWWLAGVAIVGVLFTGAEEGLFALTVLVIAVWCRRDFGKRLLLPVGVTIIGIIALLSTGHIGVIIDPNIERMGKVAMAAEAEGLERDVLLDEATGYRWLTHWRIPDIKPLGNGYNIDRFYLGIPHNVPLIIVYQVGIVGALAWVLAIVYCLIKTKWKYAFIGVLAMCVLDHYIWTQVAPWTWALAGVATGSTIKGDLIFKEV